MRWTPYSYFFSGLTFLTLITFIILLETSAEKEIPTTKFDQTLAKPTLTFQYCYSCGYSKTFEDYTMLLVNKYPGITIHGSNYNPPGPNMYLSKVIFAVKIFLIIIIVSSYDVFTALGQATPSWWRYFVDNKLYACTMIFLLGNMLEAQLISSGAFEITLNDVPVWSKLQTGRLPAPQELFQIIENHLQFTKKLQENPAFVK